MSEVWYATDPSEAIVQATRVDEKLNAIQAKLIKAKEGLAMMREAIESSLTTSSEASV